MYKSQESNGFQHIFDGLTELLADLCILAQPQAVRKRAA
jgi:hypothetical protein